MDTIEKINRAWVRELLNDTESNGVIVEFTKKDGTLRQMHCTLDMAKIPVEKHPKPKEVIEGEVVEEVIEPKEETAARVFDLEKQEWRSFCWDAVTAVYFAE